MVGGQRRAGRVSRSVGEVATEGSFFRRSKTGVEWALEQKTRARGKGRTRRERKARHRPVFKTMRMTVKRVVVYIMSKWKQGVVVAIKEKPRARRRQSKVAKGMERETTWTEGGGRGESR